MLHFVYRFIVLATWVYVSIAVASAQSAGELAGVVTDSTGAAIGSAQLQLTNDDTGVVISGVTGMEGVYRFRAIQPGRYTLVVTMSGFTETRITGIVIEVNRVTNGDVVLQVAATQQTVEVSATSQLLDMESSAKGQIITGEQLRTLPLQTRNPLALMTLTPGVVSAGGGRAFNRQGADGTVASSNFSVNGGTRTGTGGYSEYVVNGISVSNQRDGSVSSLPAADSLAEFRVQSGGMSGQIWAHCGQGDQVLHARWSNEFHGNLFEFHRSTATNARLAIPAIAEKPQNVYNQFGGSYSGPVILPPF